MNINQQYFCYLQTSSSCQINLNKDDEKQLDKESKKIDLQYLELLDLSHRKLRNSSNDRCDSYCERGYCSSHNGCTRCIDGFYIYKNKCYQCEGGCISCSGSSQCTNCKEGYFLYNGYECTKCNASCSTCTNLNTCNKCPSGQFLLPSKLCGQCPINQGYYSDTISYQCLQCSTGCSSCNSAKPEQCTTCTTGYTFVASLTNSKVGSCISCNIKNKKYINNGVCKDCHSSCQTCSDGTEQKCLSCADNKVFNEQKLCVVCETGKSQYIENNICKNCHSSCKTCSGGNNNNCLSCLPSQSLFEDTCIDCSAKLGYYINENNQCLQCNSSCRSCKAGGDKNCDSCSDLLYKHSDQSCKQCMIQQGYYIKDDQCLKCFNSCQTCFGPSQNECNSCKFGYFWIEKNGNPQEYCDLCDLNNGSYVDGQFCKKCEDTCEKCEKTIQGQLECRSCKEGLYFKDGDITKCQVCNLQDGYYINQVQQECNKCDQSCEQCTGGTNTSCVSCKDGFFRNILDHSCVKCDQIGDIQDLQSKLCYHCQGNCQTCNLQSLDQCLTCKLGTYLNEKTKQCETCDGDGVFIGSDLICKKCHFSCQKCSGSSDSECKQCNNGLVFNEEGKCITCQKEDRKFINDSGICTKCHYSCKTCENKFDNCLECSDPNVISQQGSCPVKCQNINEYVDQDGNCQKCHEKCESCHGSSEFDCNSCTKPLMFLDGTQQCLECNQSLGLFVQFSKCQKCDSLCRTCNGPNKQDCLSCQTGSYLKYDGSCSICDQKREYIDFFTNSCEKCTQNCSKCSGPKVKDCQECDSNYWFDEVSNLCTTCISDHYFVDKNSNKCRKCHTSCLQCKEGSDKDCTKCNSQLYFSNDGSCKSCQTTNGFYIENDKCKACHSSCKTCSGPQSTQCLLCQSGFFLNQGECKKCETEKGYYIDEVNSTCNKCEGQCQTCKGSGQNNCLSCASQYSLYEDGNCGTCNKEGYFVQDKYCLKCHSSCKKCKGISQNDCLECQNNSHFIDQITNNCQPCKLDSGYFIDNFICKKCHESCQKCNGESSKQCLSCYSPNMMMPNGKCGDCSDEEFVFVNNKCLQCHSNCQGCKGDSANDCIFCKEGYGFDENNFCKSCPTNGFYINPESGKCESCPNNCLSCVDVQNPFDFRCKKCQIGYLVDEVTLECVICNQSNGYYQDGSFCKKCHSTCKTCTGTPYLSCTECSGDLKKKSDSTCTDCEKDYLYFDKTTQICYDCPHSCKKCSSQQTCDECEQGFHLNQNGDCVLCDIQNGYFVSGKFCSKCNDTCKTCSDSDNCITCIDSLSMKQNSTKCELCPSNEGYFVDKNNKCKYCYGLNGFQFNPQIQKCQEVCGKGFISKDDIQSYLHAVSDIKCDDGNLLNYDGCSKSCQIEQGFDCKQIEKDNKDFKTECFRIKSGAIPKLSISRDVTQIEDTFLIKGVIKFDRDVKVLDYKRWEVNLLDKQNLNFTQFTYEIVPIQSQTEVLQEQQFQIFLRLKQNITDMNINLLFPELNQVIDSENMILSKNQVIGSLPDIALNRKDVNEPEIKAKIKYEQKDYQQCESSTSLSIVLGCLMLLFFLAGKLYYIVHFFDLLQFVHYLLYLNIAYPYFLSQIIHIFGFANFETIPNIKKQSSNAPDSFILYDIDTLFFHNIIQLTSIWVISYAIYIMSRVLVKENVKINKFTRFLKIYQQNYYYNIIIGLGIITYQEILLASLLQIYDINKTEFISIISSIVAIFFLLICGVILFSVINQDILKSKQSYFPLFFQWNLSEKKNLLYVTMLTRKILMILILVFGKSGISQILNLHLIIGIETVIIIIQKPFTCNIEYKFQVFKRVLLIFIISLITIISYDQENFEYLDISSNTLSIITSICLIMFLLTHIVYFIRSVYIMCLKKEVTLLKKSKL